MVTMISLFYRIYYLPTKKVLISRSKLSISKVVGDESYKTIKKISVNSVDK